MQICIAFFLPRDKRQKNNPAKARGRKGCGYSLARGQKKSGLPVVFLLLFLEVSTNYPSVLRR
jgi:hypothetical protein